MSVYGHAKGNTLPKDVIARIEAITKGEFIYRSALEMTWFVNHLNYMGFQWNLVDPDTGLVEDIPNDVRFRANKIQTAVAHSVAKLTRNPPDWDVDSDTQDRGVQSARNVAEKYLEYVWDKEKMPIQSKELMTMARIYGTSFIYVYWDPAGGDRLEPEDFFEGENDLPDLLEAFGGDDKHALDFLQGREKIYEGDIKIETVSPFDVYIDEAGTSVEECNWMMLVKIRSIDEVYERFGDVAKGLHPESIGDNTGPTYKYRLRQLVSPNVVSGATSQTRIDDAVLLHEYWERPGREHPNGRYVVYSNGRALHDGDNPYAHTSAELPFVRFRDQLIPDRFWGQSVVEHAIPVQRAYNKARSDHIQNSHDHASNKWIAARGMGLKQGAVDRRSDEIIEYNPIAMGSGAPLKPERVPPGQLSPLIASNIQICQGELDEIFGVHEVSKGSVPSGISSGVAIELLQEADDTRLGSILEEAHQGYATAGKMVLDLAKRFVTENRTFREILGDDSLGEIIRYGGEDLSSKNVRVRMGSLVSRKRASEQQRRIELLQYGGTELFNTPDLKKSLLAGIGISADFTDPDAVHKHRAIYENEQLKRGEIPYVTDYQNHEVHLAILEAEMNSLEFDELPQEIQMLFHQHREEHKLAEKMEMAEQLQDAATAQMEMAPPGAAAPPAEPGMSAPTGEPAQVDEDEDEGLGAPLRPQEGELGE